MAENKLNNLYNLLKADSNYSSAKVLESPETFKQSFSSDDKINNLYNLLKKDEKYSSAQVLKTPDTFKESFFSSVPETTVPEEEEKGLFSKALDFVTSPDLYLMTSVSSLYNLYRSSTEDERTQSFNKASSVKLDKSKSPEERSEEISNLIRENEAVLRPKEKPEYQGNAYSRFYNVPFGESGVSEEEQNKSYNESVARLGYKQELSPEDKIIYTKTKDPLSFEDREILDSEKLKIQQHYDKSILGIKKVYDERIKLAKFSKGPLASLAENITSTFSDVLEDQEIKSIEKERDLKIKELQEKKNKTLALPCIILIFCSPHSMITIA